MSLTPQQNLRAYVDYLRDLGIYDLYRRDEPQTLLPESLRITIAEGLPRVPVAATAPAPVSRTVPAAPPPKAALPQKTVPPKEPSSPFDLLASTLPPELASPMPKPIPFDD
jgi:hypothetical protein